jgi:hypothetical protein
MAPVTKVSANFYERRLQKTKQRIATYNHEPDGNGKHYQMLEPHTVISALPSSQVRKVQRIDRLLVWNNPVFNLFLI